MPSESPLDEIVAAAFEALDWQHSERAGWRVARVQGEHSSYEVIFRGDEAGELLMGYCLIPVRVPASRRPAVAEAIVRANFGLVLGGFDMDFADGELRYRVSLDGEGGTITSMMVQNLIFASLTSCDRYFGALMAVAHAGTSPEDAIAAVNGSTSPPALPGGTDDDAPAPPSDDPDAMEQAVHELLQSLDATVYDEDPDEEDRPEPPATD